MSISWGCTSTTTYTVSQSEHQSQSARSLQLIYFRPQVQFSEHVKEVFLLVENKTTFFVILDRYWSIRRERKETLTFTSLTFLFFWSLFLNYLFLLVYFIMELVACLSWYSLHPWGSQYSIAAFNYVETSQRLSTYCWPSAISRCLRISNKLLIKSELSRSPSNGRHTSSA